MMQRQGHLFAGGFAFSSEAEGAWAEARLAFELAREGVDRLEARLLGDVGHGQLGRLQQFLRAGDAPVELIALRRDVERLGERDSQSSAVGE